MSKYKTLVDRHECYFCGLRCDPALKKKSRKLIEVHHIKERQDGGLNDPGNLIPVCSNHHSLIHEGYIKIDRWCQSTNGWMLHWFDKENKEHWGKK